MVKKKQTDINSNKINNLILLLLVYIIKFNLNDKNLNSFENIPNIQNYKQNNFLKKITYTADGVKSSFKSDISIIFAYSFSIPLSILHFIFAPNLLTKIFGLFIFSLLIIFETLNTSIEATVDRIGSEYHVLSKVAKDTATIPSAIMFVIILISTCLLGYNIYIKFNQWEKEYLKNNNLKKKQKKKYIIVGKYIINTFKI